MLLYRISIYKIAENATKGAFVFQMKATDRDSGTNAVIKYRFSPEESAFIINETTGVVTVNGSLDRETKAKYTLSVNASDGVHFCTANLSIILIDVNDNPPVFNQTNYNVSIPEDLPVGSRVLQVFASDKDNGGNAQIVYSIDTNTSDTFSIGRDTGSFFLQKSLDYETTKSYQIPIRAMGEAYTKSGIMLELSSSAVVVVNVTDANDNPPRFLQQLYSVSISENWPSNKTVIFVTANDTDSGSNSELTYSIMTDGNNIPFAIEPTSGRIYTTEQTRECRVCSMTVVAKDGGDPSLNGSSKVTITVDKETAEGMTASCGVSVLLSICVYVCLSRK